MDSDIARRKLEQSSSHVRRTWDCVSETIMRDSKQEIQTFHFLSNEYHGHGSRLRFPVRCHRQRNSADGRPLPCIRSSASAVGRAPPMGVRSAVPPHHDRVGLSPDSGAVRLRGAPVPLFLEPGRTTDLVALARTSLFRNWSFSRTQDTYYLPGIRVVSTTNDQQSE